MPEKETSDEGKKDVTQDTSKTQDEKKEQAGDKKEEKTESKKSKESVKDTEEPEGDDSADDADDDEEEEVKSEKLLNISQARIDQIVNKRLEKQKKSLTKQHEGEVKKLNAKITKLEGTAEDYRKLVSTGVQTEIDALPEEIKKMVPASVDSADGLKKVQEWLPNAKELATKLNPKLAPTKPAGNPPSPKPGSKAGGSETEDDVLAKARKNPIYRSL
jgi:hypothetical protein